MSQWIKHDGGPMPCAARAIVEWKNPTHKYGRVCYANELAWEGVSTPFEYRIVEVPREPVRETRYRLLALNPFETDKPESFGCQADSSSWVALDILDGRPDWSTLRAVK